LAESTVRNLEYLNDYDERSVLGKGMGIGMGMGMGRGMGMFRSKSRGSLGNAVSLKLLARPESRASVRFASDACGVEGPISLDSFLWRSGAQTRCSCLAWYRSYRSFWHGGKLLSSSRFRQLSTPQPRRRWRRPSRSLSV
jgi:hypothetical protein